MNYCACCKQPIRDSEESIKSLDRWKRMRYGIHEGHYQWDIAVAWFQMSNDDFFKIYGFNFVPRGPLFDEAKERAHAASAKRSAIAPALQSVNATNVTNEFHAGERISMYDFADRLKDSIASNVMKKL